MSDADILRLDMKRKYSELSEEDFNRIYKKKVIDQYNLDEDFAEEDQLIGKIELKYAAKSIRENLIEEQKKFKAPEREPQPDQSQAIQEQYSQWKSFVDSDPTTQSILTSKMLSAGAGETAVNFEIPNVNSVLEKTYDPQKFFASFTRPDGSVDLARWYKVIAFSENIDLYDKTIINHGKTLGKQDVFAEIKNPPKPEAGKSPGGGTGDFRTDLLKEFAARGVHRGEQ